jgi:hypothetical protein
MRGMENVKPGKLWRQLPAAEYAALFPAKPKAIRKIAYGLRKLGAGYAVFTMNQFDLAAACGVSVRTLARYLPLFESYGIIDVKRWRYRSFGTAPNSYRTYFGNVIPPDWTYGGGDYPISPRQQRCNND